MNIAFDGGLIFFLTLFCFKNERSLNRSWPSICIMMPKLCVDQLAEKMSWCKQSIDAGEKLIYEG